MQRSLDVRERSLNQRETTLRVLLGAGRDGAGETSVAGMAGENSLYARAIEGAQAALASASGGADATSELQRILQMIHEVSEGLGSAASGGGAGRGGDSGWAHGGGGGAVGHDMEAEAHATVELQLVEKETLQDQLLALSRCEPPRRDAVRRRRRAGRGGASELVAGDPEQRRARSRAYAAGLIPGGPKVWPLLRLAGTSACCTPGGRVRPRLPPRTPPRTPPRMPPPPPTLLILSLVPPPPQ